MKYKIGDRVKVKSEFDFYEKYQGKQFVIEECDSSDDTYLCHPATGGYRIWISEEKLEPIAIRSVLFPNVEYVFDAEQTKELAERLNKELTGRFNAFPNDGISANKGGKNPMKFTFYVKEGTRPDKKCNGLIPTMTTTVVDASGKKATVTCDKADYSERQGVLEAIAQIACGGNFDKEYDKAAKKNKLIELHDRTCTYCGKVFDTIAERKAHEAWHVECKKARRERYLLRKRAKEIAFEEQAQKMAKEMVEK